MLRAPAASNDLGAMASAGSDPLLTDRIAFLKQLDQLIGQRADELKR